MSELTLSDYKVLHEFRFQISRFLHFSEQAARAEGLEPRQHQFMLAVRAHDGDPTVGELSERLFIRHHSAVELADRLVERGLAERVRSRRDRRAAIERRTYDLSRPVQITGEGNLPCRTKAVSATRSTT